MTSNYISMKQIWADYDTTVEMEICANVADTFCNGTAKFTNTVYTTVEQITQMLDQLSDFNDQQHSSLDIELGGFGKEWANGYVKFGLRKTPNVRVCISVFQQSDFGPTANVTVANEAKVHLVSEPSLIDRFVYDYRSARAQNVCNEVLPFGISEDYCVSPELNLTDEVFWECSGSFRISELQNYFLSTSL